MYIYKYDGNDDIHTMRVYREVKNALAEAHKQGLVNIVGDDGSLSRSAELVEAGVLLPMPGGKLPENTCLTRNLKHLREYTSHGNMEHLLVSYP